MATTRTKTKARAPKKNNFQKWLAYMKKYPPGSAPSVDSGTILVTVRKRASGYSPDRSFAELAKAYDEGIFPLMRIVSDSTIFCPLAGYDGATFEFEGALQIEEDPSSNKKTLTTLRYYYTKDAFVDESRSFVNTPVDIEVEPIDM